MRRNFFSFKVLCLVTMLICNTTTAVLAEETSIASQNETSKESNGPTNKSNETTVSEEVSASEKSADAVIEETLKAVKLIGPLPMSQYKNVNLINTSTHDTANIIPKEYSNILRYSKDTKYTVVGGNDSNNSVTFDVSQSEAVGGEHYLEVSHLGFFKGEPVTLRINIEKISTSDNRNAIKIDKVTGTSSDFLHYNITGRNKDDLISLRYEFRNSNTGKIIPDYKGLWIVKKLNNYKSLELDGRSDSLNSMYIYDKNDQEFTANDDYSGVSIVGIGGGESTTNSLMYAFNTFEGIHNQGFLLKRTGSRNVYYEQEPLTKMEIPSAFINGETNETYPKVSYKIYQDYPKQVKNEFYPSNLSINLTLEKVVDFSKLKYAVKNLDGDDVTSSFTFTPNKSENKVKIDVQAGKLSNASFVNNAYTISIESEIDSAVSADEYLEDDGYFHIPASVQMTSNINDGIVDTDIAMTKSTLGSASATYVDENDVEIADKESKSGDIGADFEFTPKEISGFTYTGVEGTPKGKFTTTNQTAKFKYKKLNEDNKAPGLNITDPVKDDETYKYDPEKDGGAVSLKAQYQDLDSDSVSVYLQVDDGEKVLIGNPAPGANVWFDAKQEYTAEQIQAILGDNKEHTFTMSAVDTEGLETSKSIKMIWEKTPNTPPELLIGLPVKDGETYEYYPENHEVIGGIVEVLANVRDFDSKTFTTYIEVDGGAPESLGIKPGGNEVYRDVSKEYTEEEIQAILADNEPHQFTMYATDSDGDTSEKVSITMIWPSKGDLTMKSVPDVSFGNQEINTIDKSYYVESKSDDLIIEDTRKEVSSWKVNAQIEQELTNQDTNKVIPSVIRYDNQVISADKLTIFEKNDPTKGTFNLSEKWIEDQKGLNLFLPVGKISSGDYDASIIWSLEDTVANET